ncbi:MAG: hypothetical protein JOY79_02180 [Acidobacteriaceae bacterium]|nr:hypothetical protein [Acidobacteriaceae bacterium]
MVIHEWLQAAVLAALALAWIWLTRRKDRRESSARGSRGSGGSGREKF